jgi:hypothetical protein
MKKYFIVLINIVVFVALLAAVEIYYRVRPGAASAAGPANGLFLNIKPYVTFSNPPHFHHPLWTNMFTGQNATAEIDSNNQGYNDPREFDWTKPYQKAPNEKVVITVGGSTVWGVGSTKWDYTIAGSMQKILNEAQSETKYTVINMGMGSWIAYQQFIGLEMWGAAFKPDWVVIMDGHNDAGVACSYSQGVTNPLYFPVIKAFVDAYLGPTNGRPEFFRGSWENELIRVSAAYRAITGKSYIKNPIEYDSTNKDDSRDEFRKIIVPTKLGAARDMLKFYMKATEAELSLFPKAKYIISTQPMVNIFTGDFVDVYKPSQEAADPEALAKRDSDLEAYLNATQDRVCNTETYIPSFTYVYVKSAFELEKMAAEKRAEGRFVEYHNIGRIFPNERNDRVKYFIDPAHLSDEGATAVGKFFAGRVLAADKAAR